MGVDSNPNTLAMCANTKFIPVVLGSRTNQQDTAATSSYFKPNHSEVIHQDKQIRLLETEQWMQHYMEEESRRKVVKAWQKLYVNVK